MNSLTFTSIVLTIVTSVLSSAFVENELFRRSYGASYPGYYGGYPSNYGGYGYGGGLGGYDYGGGLGGGFGFNPIIASNDDLVKKNNFNLNEFDHNKKAAVFAENTHKKNVNANNFVAKNNDNIAIL